MYQCFARTDIEAYRLTGSLVLIANASRKAYIVHLMYPMLRKNKR
jgi:hypothetical protein